MSDRTNAERQRRYIARLKASTQTALAQELAQTKAQLRDAQQEIEDLRAELRHAEQHFKNAIALVDKWRALVASCGHEGDARP